jgi:hypothetical protein
MNTSIKQKCFVVWAVASLCTAGHLRAQSNQDPSLKLHFDFDENFSSGEVLDMSGNGNNGWQFNPTNWITATNGVFGSTAAQFTYVGVTTNDWPNVYPLSQYIGVTNLNGFEYLTNGTISLWAQYDGGNSNNAIFLLDNGYSAIYAGSPSMASNSWSLLRDDFHNYLSFYVYPASGGTVTVSQWPDDTTTGGITTNFNLYTVTIDCSNNVAIAYWNGQPYQTNAIGVPWLHVYGCPSSRWLCIGASSHNGTPQWGDDNYPNDGFMSGKMDDIRIYNRTLSATEVQALYVGSTFARNLAIQPIGSQSVQVDWASLSNVRYQVETESALDLNAWTPLGSVISGTGGTNSITDSILGQPTGFYRVRILAR